MTLEHLDRLYASLSKHEGNRQLPYDDATGRPLHKGDRLVGSLTIGVGHNLSADGLSLSVCETILENDVASAILETERLLPWVVALDDCRKRAFVEIVFNMGSRLLSFHDALQAAQQGNWAGCVTALQQSLWARQVGHRAVDLESMLLTGTDPAPLCTLIHEGPLA